MPVTCHPRDSLGRPSSFRRPGSWRRTTWLAQARRAAWWFGPIRRRLRGMNGPLLFQKLMLFLRARPFLSVYSDRPEARSPRTAMSLAGDLSPALSPPTRSSARHGRLGCAPTTPTALLWTRTLAPSSSLLGSLSDSRLNSTLCAWHSARLFMGSVGEV